MGLGLALGLALLGLVVVVVATTTVIVVVVTTVWGCGFGVVGVFCSIFEHLLVSRLKLVLFMDVLFANHDEDGSASSADDQTACY